MSAKKQVPQTKDGRSINDKDGLSETFGEVQVKVAGKERLVMVDGEAEPRQFSHRRLGRGESVIAKTVVCQIHQRCGRSCLVEGAIGSCKSKG